MSMLDVAARLNAAKPAEIVPTGEYELKLVGGRIGEDKNGLSYVSYMFQILNPPEGIINPKPVNQFFWTATFDKIAEVHGAQRANDNDLNMRYMFEGLNFDYGQEFDTIEGPKGSTGWAFLKTDTDDYGDKNVISRWVGSSK